MKVNTSLRQAANGKSNIQVDYYLNDKRERKTTKMFYYDKPKTTIEKEHNKSTKNLLEVFIAQLTIKLQNEELGIKTPRKKINDFVVYFSLLTEQRKVTGKNIDTWTSALKHIKHFNPNGLRFNELDINWLEQFKHFLCTTQNLKSSSTNNYFNVVKHAIHDSFRDRLIDIDFATYVKAPTVEKAIRSYLTDDEVYQLEKTDCVNINLKKAFLFSCRTGMAYADIKKLEWCNFVLDHQGEYNITFHRKKTKGLQHHPISKNVKEMLGEAGPPNEKVFKDLVYNSWMNIKLQQWVMQAGISKTITFHCARHTYATMLLDKGADITVLKELLGHQDLKTTMHYAKVVGANKRIAVELLKY